MPLHNETFRTPLSGQNCLAWSEDGFLAVAAQNEIIILVPQRPWTRIFLKVCRFTPQEWPVREQATAPEMLIGEEQSEIFVTSISWSNSGLGLHKRSVLAVLTSNNLLSLWACKSDPTNSSSWERVLIINTFNDAGKGSSHIRSFAWAPQLLLVPSEVPCTPWRRGMHLLAVGDAQGRVSILRIVSPSMFGIKSWECKRMSFLNCADQQPQDESAISSGLRKPNLFHSTLQSYRSIDAVIFSPWASKGVESETVLAYRTGKTVGTFILVHSYQDEGSDAFARSSFHIKGEADELLNLTEEILYYPVTWNYFNIQSKSFLAIGHGPQVFIYAKRGAFELLKFERIYHYSFEETKSNNLFDIEIDLHGTVNNLVFCPASRNEKETHTTKTHTTIFASTLQSIKSGCLQIDPFNTAMNLSNEHPFYQQLSAHIRYTETQYKFKDKFDTKIKGMAVFEDLIAVCVVVVPEERLEYRGSAEETSTILFAPSEGKFPWEVTHILDVDRTIASIIDVQISSGVLAATAINPISARILHGSLRICLLLFDERWQERCSQARVLLTILQHFYGLDMSQGNELLESIESRTNAGIAPRGQNANLKAEELENRVREMYDETTREILDRSPTIGTRSDALLDMCPACHYEKPLLWHGLLHAKCSSDHIYSCCNLSFLPILNPKWSKSCTKCERHFINERTHPQLQDGVGKERLLAKDLPQDPAYPVAFAGNGQWVFFANFLFEMFDKCPYCNGYFSG